MERIYDRAAKLVKRTLDVEGAVLIDVSNFEELIHITPKLRYRSVVSLGSEARPQTKPLTPLDLRRWPNSSKISLTVRFLKLCYRRASAA